MSWLTDKKRHEQKRAERIAQYAREAQTRAEHEAYLNSEEFKADVAERSRINREEAREATYKFKKRAASAEVIRHETERKLASGELVVPSCPVIEKPVKSWFTKAKEKKLRAKMNAGTLTAGELMRVLGDNAAYTWTWSITNSSVASVAKTGTDTATSSSALVTGLSVGSCKVIATLNDGTETLTGSATVNVSAAPVSKLTVTLNMNLPASMVERAATMAYLTGATATGGTAPYTYEYSVTGVTASGTFRNNVYDGWCFLSDYTNTDNVYLWGSSAASGTLTIKVIATDAKGNTGEDSVDIPVSTYNTQAGYLLTGPSLVFMGQLSGVYYSTSKALPVIGRNMKLNAKWFCACQNSDDGTYKCDSLRNAGSVGGVTTTYDSSTMTCSMTSNSVTGTTSQ
ncbi:hypothetical protein [Enterobacter hormaechei]|uniref:hypothetical protein n=1 Tax=Enterobacter hormaechei TaxID=158836 RepID=UPI0029DA2771|nr:hypothetical protein [Enterobacter hormaechei]MDX7122049.1 hypothetical protein [Enterobacter hormaechei]